eukprot:jgi/Mesen1/127/ME1126805C07566
MLRVLKFLDFQPRMGIITRALAVAAPELYSFFLLLAVIFIIYSLQAHLVFGHSLDTYRSMATSMNTNFQLLISNTDIFYCTFIIFVTFILMNFLIAIIVEGFVEAKGAADNAKSMPAEVLDIACKFMLGVWRGGVSNKRVLQQLLALQVETDLTVCLSSHPDLSFAFCVSPIPLPPCL